MEFEDEKIEYRMSFNGVLEDVLVTIRPKTAQRFEAWVQVRGIGLYCWVYKDEFRSQIPGLLMPYIERCYARAIQDEAFDET